MFGILLRVFGQFEAPCIFIISLQLAFLLCYSLYGVCMQRAVGWVKKQLARGYMSEEQEARILLKQQ